MRRIEKEASVISLALFLPGSLFDSLLVRDGHHTRRSGSVAALPTHSNFSFQSLESPMTKNYMIRDADRTCLRVQHNALFVVPFYVHLVVKVKTDNGAGSKSLPGPS